MRNRFDGSIIVGIMFFFWILSVFTLLVMTLSSCTINVIDNDGNIDDVFEEKNSMTIDIEIPF